MVVLFKKNHQRLWEIVKETLQRIVPADKFAATEEKIASFAKGYATVLFFEDQDVVANLQRNFPLYADNFPLWSLQSSGMLQYMVWAALENVLVVWLTGWAEWREYDEDNKKRLL